MSNRAIKFRAWDGNRMTTSGIMFNSSTGNIESAANMAVMQFTGLTDKNGVEIYEGDVYHQGDKNIRYAVTWSGCQFLGKQISNKSQAGIMHWIDKIEVIGNIYENPELLEQNL